MIGSQPITMKQKVVDLVRKDDLFKWNILLTQTPSKIDHLAESDIPIVIALYQKHGRAPLRDRADRRRVNSDLLGVAITVVYPVRIRDAARPIVNTVHVNSRCEYVRVPS